MNNVVKLYCSEIMKKKILNDYACDYQKSGELRVEYIQKGIIHPDEWDEGKAREENSYGGVTDENLNFIELSLNKRFIGDGFIPTKKWHIGANPHRDFSDIPYVDEDIFYLGPIKEHFFHNVIEVFSRLWFFLDENNLKYKIAYCVQKGDEPNLEVFKDFFLGLNIPLENFVEIKEPTQYRTVIVSEQSFELNGGYHPIYNELYEKLQRKVISKNYEKVYLSKKYNVHGFNNVIRFPHWEYVDELFSQNGFKILYPEKLSLNELIASLKGCKMLVSQSGSSSFNAFFAPKNIDVVILNRSEHSHVYQINMFKTKNFRTTYIDVFYNKLPVFWDMGPFGFCFTDYMKQFLDDNKYRYNARKFSKLNKELVREMITNWYQVYGTWDIYPYNTFVNYLDFSSADLLSLIADSEYSRRKKLPFFKRKYLKLKAKLKKMMNQYKSSQENTKN